jgi:hypothetical protein
VLSQAGRTGGIAHTSNPLSRRAEQPTAGTRRASAAPAPSPRRIPCAARSRRHFASDGCPIRRLCPISTRNGRLAGTSSAGATGLEPATSGVTGRRSNQLSYAPGGDSQYRRRDRLWGGSGRPGRAAREVCGARRNFRLAREFHTPKISGGRTQPGRGCVVGISDGDPLGSPSCLTGRWWRGRRGGGATAARRGPAGSGTRARSARSARAGSARDRSRSCGRPARSSRGSRGR